MAYIDREAAAESLNALKPFLRDKWQARLLRRVMSHIGKIPAADVAPVVHGRWIEENKGPVSLWHCSECKTLGSPQWKGCPVCLARMDGE